MAGAVHVGIVQFAHGTMRIAPFFGIAALTKRQPMIPKIS